MRRLLIVFPLVALLISCGKSSGVACESDYWDGTIGTCIPAGWEVVNRETLRQRGVPEETIVGFQHTEAVSGQFPTMVVTEEKLTNAVDAMAYSEANIRAVSVLNGYEKIDAREFTVDGEKVLLHVFSGQPIEGEPLRRFYQFSTAKEERGYTVTAVTPVAIDSNLESQVMLMMEHFTLLEPKEE